MARYGRRTRAGAGLNARIGSAEKRLDIGGDVLEVDWSIREYRIRLQLACGLERSGDLAACIRAVDGPGAG